MALDFKLELKKYQPILELEDVESSLKNDDIQDIIDLLEQLTKKD